MPTPARARARRRPPTLKALIDHGYLLPPVRLRASYRGHRFTALITADGKVKYRGRLYDGFRRTGTPLSTLAGLALMEVREPPPGRRIVPSHGWLFWKVPSGAGWIPISSIRGRYLHSDRPVS